MPFDFKKYDAKCATLDGDALQLEWEHYTRLISGAATSTAVSGMAVPFTLGVSSIGVGLAAPAIHNARKKREIIERHLQRHGRTHHTRKRDVLAAGAISGTVGIVTLGLAPVGADAICNSAAGHGLTYIAENELGVKVATHLVLDAAGVAAEESHMHSKKEQVAWNAYAQAVKEGKNPSLPASHMKMPTNPSTQVVDTNQDQFGQTAPSISVIPPSEHKLPVETSTLYFAPPPDHDGLKVSNVHNRRHSVSTLSLNTLRLSEEQPKLRSDGHFMYGTTTAISNPMLGGQSYCIELPSQSAELPSRPSSAMAMQNPSTQSVSSQQATNTMPMQTMILPHPPSPYIDQTSTGLQQLRPHIQRPRAHSFASSDSLPSYKAHQQTRLLYGMSAAHVPPPPPPLTPPPSVPISPTPPMHTSTTTTYDYFSSSPGSTKPSFADQAYQQQMQNANNSTNRTASYNPNSYEKPKQQYDPLLSSTAVFPSDSKYSVNDQKTPFVYQYQLNSPVTPTSPPGFAVSPPAAAQVFWTTPDPRQAQSFPPEKQFSWQNQQQTLYFPPPPTAY